MVFCSIADTAPCFIVNMDFTKDLEKLNEEFLQSVRKQRSDSLEKRAVKDTADYDRLEDRYFDLLKNCTILSGTIFASAAVLSTGKDVTCSFIIGEFFMLGATLVGILYLWSQLKSLEWSYFFERKSDLEGDLIVYKDVISQFEREGMEMRIKDYNKLITQKGFSYYILKVIKVDWLPTFFFTMLTVGLLLVWFSLL